MKAEWMMFANYAEEREGLLFLSGASWDTIQVRAPLTGGPPDVVAQISGFLVIRLLFHSTETDRNHSFALVLMNEDGQELQKHEGEFPVPSNPNLPAGWDQGVNIITGLTGMPLPEFGRYEFNLLINGQHAAVRPFRLLKLY